MTRCCFRRHIRCVIPGASPTATFKRPKKLAERVLRPLAEFHELTRHTPATWNLMLFSNLHFSPPRPLYAEILLFIHANLFNPPIVIVTPGTTTELRFLLSINYEHLLGPVYDFTSWKRIKSEPRAPGATEFARLLCSSLSGLNELLAMCCWQQSRGSCTTTNDQMMFVGICLLLFYYFSIFSFLLCCSVLACAHASLSLPQNNKMSINILLLSGRCCGLLSPGGSRRNLCCRGGASVMWRNYGTRRSEKFSDSTLILHRSIGQ